MFIAGENKRVFLRMDYHTRKKTLKKGKRKKEKGLFLLREEAKKDYTVQSLDTDVSFILFFLNTFEIFIDAFRRKLDNGFSVLLLIVTFSLSS